MAWGMRQLKQVAKRTREVFPGPPPNFLSGNINYLKEHVPRMGTPAQLFDSMFKEYGDTFRMEMGPMPIVYTRDLDLIKFILNNDPEKISKMKLDFLMKDILGQSLIFTDGEDWYRKSRLMRNAFKRQALEGFVPKIHLSAQEISAAWRKEHAMGREVEVLNWFNALSMDIIGRVGFGVDFQCVNKPGDNSIAQDFAIMFKESELLQEKQYYFLLGATVCREYSSHGKRYKAARDRLVKLIHGNLAERERINASQGKEEKKNDLLQYLIESSGEEGAEDEKERDVGLDTSSQQKEKAEADAKQHRKYTNDELVQEVVLFYLAGHETTSNLLSWTIYYLSKHPEILERVRAELAEKGNPTDDSVPDFAFYNDLPYLTQVIKETLRLHPALAGFTRCTIDDMEYKGKIIPGKLMFSLQSFSVHRDERHYGPAVDTWNPDNFTPEKIKTRPPLSWIPFAAGQRNCIGMQLALLEARAVLSYVLPRFKFTPTTEAQLAERNTIMTSANMRMKIEPLGL